MGIASIFAFYSQCSDVHFCKKNLLPHRQEMLAQGLDPNPPARQDHEKVPFPKYEEYQVGLGVDNCLWAQKLKPY